MRYTYGIRANLKLFLQLLVQVFAVGLTLGLMRTVVPALAASEFGVPRSSFLLLSAFMLAFGVVKALMNLVAGGLSERLGRWRVLQLGWLMALPVPVLVWYAPSWSWVVAATLLLGVNQGLTWSMTQAAQLDITRTQERGLTLGLNEFAGYAGVALAGVLTAGLASWLGARQGLLVFGLAVILAALILSQVGLRETLPWARAEATQQAAPSHPDGGGTYPPHPSHQAGRQLTPWAVFRLVSWRDRRFLALCQAGLVEKFVDALVWVIYPVYLLRRGLGLTQASSMIGVYGLVWGLAQLGTGRWSDRFGRQRLSVWGMWLCGAGVTWMVLGQGVLNGSLAAALSGLGMAMLYPSLSAAVADIAHPDWRGTALGVYRFWRDLGYAVGALGLGLVTHVTGRLEAAFGFVALSMAVSGLILWGLGEETHPRWRRTPSH